MLDYISLDAIKHPSALEGLTTFSPDKTVYDTERGSYFASYNSFRQTLNPVSLTYLKKKMITVAKRIRFN